tara:strand:- start:2408 stop:2692 length:285 start_codon:yes stop_codon:yes gene_type:complete
MSTSQTLEQMIDELGAIKAQLSNLESKESKLKATITEMIGVGAHEGEMFRVSVSVSQRETLDMEAVRNHLSAQFIRAHTNSKDVVTVRVSARKS